MTTKTSSHSTILTSVRRTHHYYLPTQNKMKTTKNKTVIPNSISAKNLLSSSSSC